MDMRGNFSARAPNRVPSNLRRSVSNFPIQQKNIESSVAKDNTIYYLIGGLLFLIVIVIGAIFFLSSKEETVIPYMTSDVDICSIVDISVSSLSSKTCYAANESLLKIYAERGANQYVLKAMTFILYSSSDKLTYVSNYSLPINGKYNYSINFQGLSDVKRFEIIPTLKDGDSLKNCSKILINSVYPCASSVERSELQDNTSNISTGQSGSSNTIVVSNNTSVTNTTNADSFTLGSDSSYAPIDPSSDSQIDLADYLDNTL